MVEVGPIIDPVFFLSRDPVSKKRCVGGNWLFLPDSNTKQMLFFWKLNNLVDNYKSKTTRKTRYFQSDSWASTKNFAAFSRSHRFNIIKNQPSRKCLKKRYQIIANKWNKDYNLQKYLIDNRDVGLSNCGNKNRKICREN